MKKKDGTPPPIFFVAPEGIWLFTDINKEGTHANAGNRGSIGIEIVGNYDEKLPRGEIWKNAKLILTALMIKFGLSSKEIYFHRKYNTSKSCPGRAITRAWLKSQLNHN